MITIIFILKRNNYNLHSKNPSPFGWFFLLNNLEILQVCDFETLQL
jgi:hypothetical protein